MDDFEKLYREYFGRVYSFLYKMCRDSGLSEELTQETFFQVYLSFHRYRGESAIFTYLAAVAKNVYFRYLKKNKTEFLCIDDIALFSDDNSEEPYEALEKKVSAEKITVLVRSLPKKYSDVVFLRIYAELPFAEIADNLKITENSAKVLFFRAKKMLKEAIDDENDSL